MLNVVFLHPDGFEMAKIVEVLTPGEQRCDKAFGGAPISIVGAFFFDKKLLEFFWQPHLVFLLNSDCFVICMLPAMWHISCTCLAKERKIHPCSALKIVLPSVRPLVLCGGIAVLTLSLEAD